MCVTIVTTVQHSDCAGIRNGILNQQIGYSKADSKTIVQKFMKAWNFPHIISMPSDSI